MPLNFTKKDLKDFAGETVFNRGLKYYHDDAVDEIKTVADKYTAKVYGSRIYNVEYAPAEDVFSCNCPYDGFCKHLVAFGLKLLDEKNDLPETQNFDEWYADIDDETKLRFLERLVRNDNTLKEKLDKMSRQTGRDNDDVIDVNDVAEVVYDTLSALTYDDVLSSHYQYDYYIEEYEVIDDLVRDALDDYFSEARELTQYGKPEQAFDYILGIILGLEKSEDTEIAEYQDGFSYFIDELLTQFTKSLMRQPNETKTRILNRLINFYRENNLDIIYYFSDFLSGFVTKDHSEMLKQFLLNYSGEYSADNLLMRIAELDKDTDLMQKLLKDNHSSSLHIPYLKILKDNGEFAKMKQIMVKFLENDSVCELEQFVLPELGNETYKEFLLLLITKCFKPEYYKIYKDLISEDEKQEFLTGIRKNISHRNERYALPVLFEEKSYEPVLEYIKKQATSEYAFDSYEKYLQKISRIMPGEVWLIYFLRVEHLFASRNRNAYAAMAYYLKLMKRTDKKKTNELISSYYNHKPVLRALRDEFRKAGIV